MKAQKYSTAMQKAPDEGPKRSSTECVAHGCRLPGVYRVSDAESFCCVHDGEDPHRWPIQTRKIDERFDLFDTALRMTNAQAGAKPSPALVERLTGMGAAEPGNLTVRAYGAAIKLALVAECRGPREVPKALQKLREATDTWQKVEA